MRNIIYALKSKVYKHRKDTRSLLEDMCKARIILLNEGCSSEAKLVEQACVRMHEVETAFDNVDACLYSDLFE
jgi:hypothetical protein